MLIDDQKALPTGFNPNFLKLYYAKLFPFGDIFRWMSYGNDGKHPACDKSYFGRRELSFTLENDIYLRFLSFNSVSELEKGIREKCPFKIDIGPVYSVDNSVVKLRHGLFPFICSACVRLCCTDDNLYFSILKCCLPKGMHISKVARMFSNQWRGSLSLTLISQTMTMSDIAALELMFAWTAGPLMTAAIKVIDASLRGPICNDFGFRHILWVYSGRRGVHCWVCDGKARRLTNEQRAAIADYFRIYKGSENSKKKVSLTGHALHPFLVRSYTEVLKELFEQTLLSSQQIFSTEDRCEKILEMIPDESVAAELRGRWQKKSSGSKDDINTVRWEQLKHTLQSGRYKGQGLRKCVEEIVFSFSYPRLDMEVSKHMNHLLKAPFCVHPKTGRVCVPIDPVHCHEFNPTTVPTLSQLLQELNSGGMGQEGDNDWDRTSVGESVRFFSSSFLEPLLKSCKEEMESIQFKIAAVKKLTELVIPFSTSSSIKYQAERDEGNPRFPLNLLVSRDSTESAS